MKGRGPLQFLWRTAAGFPEAKLAVRQRSSLVAVDSNFESVTIGGSIALSMAHHEYIF